VLTERRMLEFDYRDRRAHNRDAQRAIAAAAPKLGKFHVAVVVYTRIFI